MSTQQLPDWAVTLLTISAVSFAWSNGWAASEDPLDGSLLRAVTSDDKPLSASYWPFSLMLTAHVVNVCAQMGNDGFWAGRLVKGAFAAYGGLMMKDLLAGDFTFSCLMAGGEARFTLLYVALLCWRQLLFVGRVCV